MFGWDFLLMLSRDSEDEMWSRFMFELLIWLQEATLARWTQSSGPLCLWQCLYSSWCDPERGLICSLVVGKFRFQDAFFPLLRTPTFFSSSLEILNGIHPICYLQAFVILVQVHKKQLWKQRSSSTKMHKKNLQNNQRPGEEIYLKMANY